MSIDQDPKPPADLVRWLITLALGVLALICIGWIAASWTGRLSDVDPAGRLLAGFTLLNILAFIGLGVWVLRPPLPGAVTFLGRWTGKVVLFLGLALAIFVFLFATCLAVGLSSI
jgi:hypothetical protein